MLALSLATAELRAKRVEGFLEIISVGYGLVARGDQLGGVSLGVAASFEE